MIEKDLSKRTHFRALD